MRRNFLETVTISDGVALMPGSMTSDILGMEIKGKRCAFTIQTTGKDQVKIISEDKSEIKIINIEKPGIHKIEVDL